jgi:hypothetical protein
MVVLSRVQESQMRDSDLAELILAGLAERVEQPMAAYSA